MHSYSVEDLAFSEENQRWILEEIRKAIYPNGLRKVADHLRYWGLLATCITVFVAVIAMAVSLGIYVVNTMGRESEFRGATNEQLKTIGQRLTNIETSLKTVNDRFAVVALKEMGRLDKAQFAKSLPALRQIQENLTLSVKPDQETLREIAAKLRDADSQTPDYWPTVLQFIRFASASLIAPTDVPPANAHYSIVSSFNCSGVAHCMTASHCAVILDGGSIPNSTFDHCRIRFTNNPVGLEGTRFTDCIFEIPADITQPTPYLKNSVKTLLASDLRQVTFPG